MILGDPDTLAIDISVHEEASREWNHLWVSAGLVVHGERLPGSRGAIEQAYIVERDFDPRRWQADKLRFASLLEMTPLEAIIVMWERTRDYFGRFDEAESKLLASSWLVACGSPLDDFIVLVLGQERGFSLYIGAMVKLHTIDDGVEYPTRAWHVRVDEDFFERMHADLMAWTDRESNIRNLPVPWRRRELLREGSSTLRVKS